MKKHVFLLLALLMTALGIPGIILLQDRLDGMLHRYKLIGEQFAEDGGAPPGVAFSTVFLGGFRNLVADALWLRMTTLQDEGNYYELVQLADWILKVQPSNAQVAQYLAWNMAYNISVIQQDFPDRWRWVRKGIETMVEATKLNPNEPMLYRELAWLFYFKLGDQTDTANLYYKFKLAEELFKLYGNRHSPDWEALAKAPANKAEFMARFPDSAGKRSVLWTKQYGFADYAALEKYFYEHGSLPDKLKEVLGEKETAACENGLRRILLKKYWFMEPQYALDVEKKYGKLDWLHSSSLAMYWAIRGIEVSPHKEDLNCKRVLSNALRISFTSGRILFPAGVPAEDYLLLPNLNLMDAVNREYEEEHKLRPGPYNAGHTNFLSQAIDTFYFYGRKKEAMKYFLILRDQMKYGDACGLTLEQFVENRLRIMIKGGTWYQMIRLVQSFIVQSAFALGNGDRAEAEQMLDTAEQLYKIYVKRMESEEEKIRLKIPSFAEFKRQVTLELMRSVPALAPALKAELEMQKAPVPEK